MVELHAHTVHKKAWAVESGVVPEGSMLNWTAVLVGLLVLKMAAVEEMRRCVESIVSEVCTPLTPSLAGVFIANGVRWMAVCEYVKRFYGKKEPMNGRCLVVVLVGLELVVAAYSPEGYVGVGMRYLSTLQVMKALSYVLVSMEESRRGKERGSPLRFIVLPTACYQRGYPTRERVRTKRALFLLALMPVSAVLARHFIAVQSVLCARRFLEELSLSAYVDLVIYANLGWASVFIPVFVSFFALLAELTRFGDCCFFEDWWSAGVREYWRRWNKDVHVWIKRHLYVPLVSRGSSPKVVSAWIFLGSGLVHDYVIGGAVGLRGAGFITMASQSLLIYLSDAARKAGVSENLFCIAAMNFVGAPLMALLVVGNEDKAQVRR